MALSPLHRTARARRAAGITGAVLAATVLAACTTGSVGSGPSSSASLTPALVPPGSTAPDQPGGTADAGPGAGTTAASTGGATPSLAATTAPSGRAQPSGSGAPKTVPVQITIHDWNAKQGQAEVDAFVPGEVIAGGTCTLTMTQGSVHRTATHRAVTTPASTSCGLITIAGSQLGAGSWQAVVRFQAPTATGASDPVTIQVPA